MQISQELQTAHNAQKTFELEYAKMLQDSFPIEKLSNVWKDSLELALARKSPMDLQSQASDFLEIAVKANEMCSTVKPFALSMLQFAICNTAIQLSSADDLELNIVSYARLQVECAELADWWNAEVEPRRKELEQRIERKAVQQSLNKKAFKGMAQA